MRRLALVVIPIVGLVTGLVGLYFIYVGGRTIMMGRYIAIGLGFAGFGGVGLILSYAMWSVRRQILVAIAPPAADDQPPARAE